MANSEWWQPDVLKNCEIEARATSDASKLIGDFRAYKLLLQGAGGSAIELHNDVNPLVKVRAIHRAIGPIEPISVLDAGCGVGFTTAALAVMYPRAEVLGIDISVDGIEYATRVHQRVKFKAQMLSPSTPDIGKFDLIYCVEFYPFTRNTDITVQKDFVDFFCRQLNCGGKLVIYQTWKNKNSLAAVYNQVRAALPQRKFEIRQIPHPKVYQILPYPLAFSFCKLMSWLPHSREWLRNVVVVSP